MRINDTYFVLDTETGGLNPQEHSLMEIAGVVVKGAKIVYEYSTLVASDNGKYNCGEYARKLHGITDEMCEEQGKRPHEIISDLFEWRYYHVQPNHRPHRSHVSARQSVQTQHFPYDAQQSL